MLSVPQAMAIVGHTRPAGQQLREKVVEDEMLPAFAAATGFPEAAHSGCTDVQGASLWLRQPLTHPFLTLSGALSIRNG